MPGRRSDPCHLETGSILRILDVLDKISPGPLLLITIGHLTGYAERRVASKTALLIGGRLQNHEWVERHLSSPDARVRANVVEVLWGVDSGLAARTLRKCLQDENNRVRSNAMIGLYMLGDRNIDAHVRRMAEDSRPTYRQTAAWVIGGVRSPELGPLLEGLLKDPNEQVCHTARNALEWLRTPERTRAGTEGAPPQTAVGNEPARPDEIATPSDSPAATA